MSIICCAWALPVKGQVPALSLDVGFFNLLGNAQGGGGGGGGDGWDWGKAGRNLAPNAGFLLLYFAVTSWGGDGFKGLSFGELDSS